VNNVIFDIRVFNKYVSKFLFERADLINVATEVLTNLDGKKDIVGSDVKPLLSCADLLLGEDDEGLAFQKDFTAFTSKLTEELIWVCLADRYQSVPDEYTNTFYAMALPMIIDGCISLGGRKGRKVCDEERWTKLTKAFRRSFVTTAAISTSDINMFIQELKVEIYRRLYPMLPNNEWVVIDFTVTGSRLVVTTGEDLRHIIFRKEHTEERWTGEYHLPNGQCI